MKKLILTAAALLASTAVGFAADLPARPAYKAVPMAAPVFSWTGFYFGGQVGGGWGHEALIDNSGFTGTVDHRLSGIVAGGQAGFRWQWNQLVLGVEGTGAWADVKSSITQATSGVTENFKVNSIYTATGQIGFAIDRWLPYVKGGWAGAHTAYFVANPVTASHSYDASGWTVGGGIDYAMTQNWVAGVEYSHFDFNYPTFSSPASNGGAPFVVSTTSRLTVDQVVGRVSYKF